MKIERLLADPVVPARVDRATGSAVSTLVANGVEDNALTRSKRRLERAPLTPRLTPPAAAML